MHVDGCGFVRVCGSGDEDGVGGGGFARHKHDWRDCVRFVRWSTIEVWKQCFFGFMYNLLRSATDANRRQFFIISL